MKDIQNEVDRRNIALKNVGIKDFKLPISVLDREAKTQKTIAKIDASVDLPHDVKGTHMSRFIEIIKDMGSVSPENVENLGQDDRKLESKSAYMKINLIILLKSFSSY